jgi:hypothetical protein
MTATVSAVEYGTDDFIEQCMAAELSFELIDPATAEEMLKHNTSNYRKLSDGTVERYMKDLESNLWTYTTDAVGFTSGGILTNGQHRLHAIARSGKSVWMFVMRNLPEEFANDPNQDKGKMRSVAVYINKLGVKNANTAAAAIRFLYRLAIGSNASRVGATSLTDPQVLKCVEFMPQQFFDWVDAVSGCATAKKVFAGSVNAAFFYLASCHDKETAQRFFDVYSRRVDESSSHPANTLREQVTSNRKLINNDKFFNLAFTAFACALRGENRKLLRSCGGIQLPTGSKRALDSLLEILKVN